MTNKWEVTAVIIGMLIVLTIVLSVLGLVALCYYFMFKLINNMFGVVTVDVLNSIVCPFIG